jgi:hypothetical protein
LGARVTIGVRVISRTLKTLIPNTSGVPTQNSKRSIVFEAACRVLSSTTSSMLL